MKTKKAGTNASRENNCDITGTGIPNPWLAIPPEDYEGHMGDPAVAQLQFLDQVFSRVIKDYDVESIALLGCATGNGLAHIDTRVTNHVAAVDIHPGYLDVLRNRYCGKITGLEVIEGDLAVVELDRDAYTLISAGLLFEYLDPAPLLKKISRWLRPGGILSAVLQLPAPHHAKVSPTQYHSLQGLEPIMRLVAPADLVEAARTVNLREVENRSVELASGKPFQIMVFEKQETEPRQKGRRPRIHIVNADSGDSIETAKRLFQEYAASLDFDLSFQNFEAEMDDFPRQYRPPSGSLFLALSGDLPVGCVGIRYFAKGICEMKRLYVRPEFRGQDGGRQLAEHAIREARELGYRTMRLDTVPSMERANTLYRSLGFYPIPPYRHNPLKGARYLQINLNPH